MLGWFLTRIDVNTPFLHTSLDGQEEVCAGGVSRRMNSRRLSMGVVQLQDSGVSRETPSSLGHASRRARIRTETIVR